MVAKDIDSLAASKQTTQRFHIDKFNRGFKQGRG
jgi:hypothetical protein